MTQNNDIIENWEKENMASVKTITARYIANLMTQDSDTIEHLGKGKHGIGKD